MYNYIIRGCRAFNISDVNISNVQIKIVLGCPALQTFSNLPVSHLSPVYPAAHVQLYPLIPSTHVAPFIHGLASHSLMSCNRHTQTNSVIYNVAKLQLLYLNNNRRMYDFP